MTRITCQYNRVYLFCPAKEKDVYQSTLSNTKYCNEFQFIVSKTLVFTIICSVLKSNRASRAGLSWDDFDMSTLERYYICYYEICYPHFLWYMLTAKRVWYSQTVCLKTQSKLILWWLVWMIRTHFWNLSRY